MLPCGASDFQSSLTKFTWFKVDPYCYGMVRVWTRLISWSALLTLVLLPLATDPR